MNAAEARRLMRCHRADDSQGDDPQVKKAVGYAGGKEDLAAELRRQVDLDSQLRAVMKTLAPPDGLLERALAAQRPDARAAMHWRGAFKQPAIVAAAIGLLVILGFCLYFGWLYLDSFPGKEAVSRMIATTDEMSADEIDPLPASTEAGKVGDWFFLHDSLEHFDVPREFANLTAVGGHVFRQDGNPVAQIAIEQNNMLFFIFRAADFGVKLFPPDRWRIFLEPTAAEQQEDWVVALRCYDDNCFMIAFRGKKAQMKKYLESKH